MTNTQLMWLGVGIAVVFVFAAKAAADEVAQAVDITSADNLAYELFNSVGDVLNDGEDDDDFNLGESIFYLFNGDGD